MGGGIIGRFAPSPSGRLHLGNLFCSLLAWLSAKAKGGEVVLRIEDLDRERSRLEYAEQLEGRSIFRQTAPLIMRPFWPV